MVNDRADAHCQPRLSDGGTNMHMLFMQRMHVHVQARCMHVAGSYAASPKKEVLRSPAHQLHVAGLQKLVGILLHRPALRQPFLRAPHLSDPF